MRRQNTARILLATFVITFVTVFLINQNTFINAEAKTDLANFDAGLIISDFMMSKADAMSEEEIQNFLTAKNSCSNTDEAYYNALASSSSYKWHFKDGHFVCLSEELFGEGEIIGEGETAAHIIWQAAQDYQINPQVLLVLLQKETGLITDPIPNDKDYRKATGFGCPDNAACSEKYYGFKNQIRNAAELFHTVVTGGWTNFILGENYIQFNPNPGCGGSMVNIRSLATAALYRYTPYQPNVAALAAGYGTAECGAYGNRNFYLYFNDWFGDPTFDGWQDMATPRYMTNIATEETAFYSLKRVQNGKLCLGTEANKTTCTNYEELKEVEWEWLDMETPRYMAANQNTMIINLKTEKAVPGFTEESQNYYFTKKVTLPENRYCLLSEAADDWCAIYETLGDASWPKQEMLYKRTMVAKQDTSFVDPITRGVLKEVKQGEKYFFEDKYIVADNKQCLAVKDEAGCVPEESLAEDWLEMEVARDMKTVKDTYKVQSITSARSYDMKLDKGLVRKFVEKMKKGDEWCLRTEYDNEHQNNL